MIRARSRWNSVRNAWPGSEFCRPRESPDFSANGASTVRSLASISSRVLKKGARRGAGGLGECLVTIDSQSYLSTLAFETSNPIWPGKLLARNPPKDGFAVANKAHLNI